MTAEGSSDGGPVRRAAKQDVPATRLFKVLNPELYMRPNRLIMYGGVAAMAGIAIWLGSAELKHRKGKHAADIMADLHMSAQQPPTYQDRMAELKRRSA
ncbi:hypothetical protein LPJ61_002604 [Coemansia biformis]|uniref:Small integral membrane protein 8 n=1 Tax=Coemansia biformis TaxID=1286918 RepID=A0A9W8CZ12_9FUNG|nr:hypothetical protein LPJ61_002604 [Coemansia biformis]